MNKWARSFEWNKPSASPAGGKPAHSAPLYFAFLSYSHHDSTDADWLHGELERFRVPSSLTGRLTAAGVVPKRLTPIFRDRHELAAADDLGEEIREALAGSRCLIVLCSPAAAVSKWTNAEIETFKQLHPEGCIIAAIVGGEPFASDIPGREQEECLLPALRQKYDRRGRPTGKRAEPLAADLREGHGGRRLGFLKIVAGMLGLGLDDLVQRDQLRRQRRLAGIAAASLGGMVIASVLAVTAIDARDSARDQRREAESLVEFMLGDLKDKLEPVGRLDVLDGVGSRVMAYYSKQDMTELSDQGLAQRSRALTLMGQIARDRGDLDRANALYRSAYAGTAEAMRRQPENPERLFDHAQNAFYIADIALRRGQSNAAESAFREYERLADRMVAMDPDNIRWRMEVQYAATNLGIVLFNQRRFSEAAQQFARSATIMRAFAVADPANDDYQAELSEGLAWLADAQASEGRLDDAIETRRQQMSLLDRLSPQRGTGVGFRLITALRGLGNLHADRGESDLALQRLRAAVAQGEKLLAIEPTNTRWADSTARARLDLAQQLLGRGLPAEASAQANSACATYQQLFAQDRTVQTRRAGIRNCLLIRARLAVASGDPQQALRYAQQALEASRSVATNDPAGDKHVVAEINRVLGDIRMQLGDSAAARAAWAAAFESLPKEVGERPREMNERELILRRTGRNREAAALAGKLKAMGFDNAV